MSVIKCENCKRKFKVDRSKHTVYCPYCNKENKLFWTTGDIVNGIIKLLIRL